MDSTSRSGPQSRAMYTDPNEAEQVYSSSLFVEPTTNSHVHETSPPVGLGISACGLENAFSDVTAYSHLTPLSTNLATQHHGLPLMENYIFPLGADDFCGRSCFEIYSGLPQESHPSLSPCQVPAPSLGTFHGFQYPSPNYTTGNNVSLGSTHCLTNNWTGNPVSASITPPQSVSFAAGPAFYSPWPEESLAETSSPLQPEVPVPIQSAFQPSIPPVFPSGSNRLSGDGSMTAVSFESQNISPTETTADASSHRPSKRGRKPSVEKGCSCPVCGFHFTRRSNCVAHQKKHDPTYHRSIACDECNKSFGRNADLRRHVDTVSGSTEWVGSGVHRKLNKI